MRAPCISTKPAVFLSFLKSDAGCAGPLRQIIAFSCSAATIRARCGPFQGKKAALCKVHVNGKIKFSFSWSRGREQDTSLGTRGPASANLGITLMQLSDVDGRQERQARCAVTQAEIRSMPSVAGHTKSGISESFQNSRILNLRWTRTGRTRVQTAHICGQSALMPNACNVPV